MNKIKELKELVYQLTKAEINGGNVKYSLSGKESNFSKDELQEQLRLEFKELAKDYNSYRRNKLVIFELIQESVDQIMPKKVKETIGMFADIKVYGQGQKAEFTTKIGNNRAKKFITKVGLSGVYETFRLDNKKFTVTTSAYGGAAQIELEEFLDGNVDFSDLMNIIIDGLEDSIYTEIMAALEDSITQMPAANQSTGASFNESESQAVVNAVMAYGTGATIFCTKVMAAKFQTSSNYIADADKNDIRNQGYLGKFFGADIVVLPQSFTDETNEVPVLSDERAWVIPNGGAANEKIVKVALEGQSIVDEAKNRDQSTEIQAYKKFGTAVLFNNHIGTIEITIA